ncbi:MAG: hypothetical protein BJ554DRAFT_1709 [Olpidium bornovanus]|uniref:Uncharacterized protein n=1 Tax=Olpidium bornovanus TaxID=278681 RepID=A0A8H7ZRL4_9FUNG|nr:MAG: hypothetical protein BJ554DRAFT_1709 [Olpidium bornovanus]
MPSVGVPSMTPLRVGALKREGTLDVSAVMHANVSDAQVEQVRLGLPKDQPLAVQQWSTTRPELLVSNGESLPAKHFWNRVCLSAESEASEPLVELVGTQVLRKPARNVHVRAR